ncbi:tetratricopeptide repeat protein [Halothiobacillus diazotrophicus]|uniref:tetratricopeptide repeat protein n=1 Tax=Halothiobacillus diazotrophicus TaxID=1860122 RepID=UPI0009ECE9C1|nr:hypothetical protein [Halothiobacillus diazotrophicus]
MTGTFLFDDYSNLPPMGDYGPIRSLWQAIAWITSGFAGPTGRPVSLASFLIDTRVWPASPAVFKTTNIVLHLLTGIALIGLLHALSRAFDVPKHRALWVAVLAGGMWLLHPLWVSTTLYIVQRMAILAALFVFAGLWAYVHGRLQLIAGRTRRGYLWMSLGLVLGTLLAVLSKENGALLPLLAWAIEKFVFDAHGRVKYQEGAAFIWWRRVFITLPSLVLLAYLISQLPMLFSGLTYGRDFTPYERLLTETRILWRYLWDLWLPGVHDGGLFNDDIRLSTSLWRPFSTLPATIGLLALIGLALFWRRSERIVLRAIGLTIIFFFVGQLLESTWLQLELMFEHRNYLPAGLMFFPLALFLVDRVRGGTRWPVWLAIGIFCVLGLLTYKRADLWGKPFQQALTWAHEHPDSARAQSYLANFWEQTGNYPEAARLLDRAFQQHPQDLLVLANRALLACDTGEAPTDLGRELLKLARTGQLAQNVVGYQFDTFLSRLQENCAVFGVDFGFTLIDAALTNPQVLHAPDEQRSLLHRRAMLWLDRNEVTQAYADMLTALRLPDLAPGTRLLFAAELASAHHQRRALALLDAVPPPLADIHGWSMGAIHRRWLAHVGYYHKAEIHLRETLEKEIAAASG